MWAGHDPGSERRKDLFIPESKRTRWKGRPRDTGQRKDWSAYHKWGPKWDRNTLGANSRFSDHADTIVTDLIEAGGVIRGKRTRPAPRGPVS